MREFELLIDDALKVGLSPEQPVPTNSQYLSECLGFRIGKLGLEGYRELTNPLPGTVDIHYVWPFPQFLTGEKYNFLIVRDGTVNMQDSLYQVSDDHQTVSLILDIDILTFGQGTLMEVADFGKYAFLTNGVVMIYWDTVASNWKKVTSITNIPMMRTVCNFKGQLVGGNVVSSWHGCDETYFVWSKIGEADFTPDRRNEAGYKRDPHGGVIYHTRRLGDQVIGYTSKGITALRPVGQPAATFGFTEMSDVGLINQGAMNGNKFMQVYVGDDYVVRKITANGIEDLGYQHLMKALTGDIIVSYDPSLKDFYIGDSETAYLLSINGMSELPQYPSAIWRNNKSTYSLPGTVNDYEPLIKSEAFNMQFAGQKTIATIETDAKYSDDGQAAVDYLNDQDTWNSSNYSPLNNQGIATVPAAGNEFRFALKFDSVDYETRISYIKSRYKMTDLRGIRGVYAPAPRGQY